MTNTHTNKKASRAEAIEQDEELRSCLCTQGQLESDLFRSWLSRMKQDFKHWRKLWEYAFIAQALSERGMLTEGKRGLGFGCGHEPLVSLFVSEGVQVMATDQSQEVASSQGWADVASIDQYHVEGVCEREMFDRLASFRVVDMRAIPKWARGFDFVWSSCALEHLGTLEQGKQFIYRSLECVRPGGVLVHTTEYNLSSDFDTLTEGQVTAFTRRDIQEVVRTLRAAGCAIAEPDFSIGNMWLDWHVDESPFDMTRHLRLRWEDFIITSIGLIIRR